MANAPYDQNRVKSRLAVLNTDSTVTIPIAIDETTGSMRINEVDTVQFTMTPLSPRDENYHTCMLFKGSDGLTYPWVADATGAVLIDQ
jgi:hypothetical protein